MKESCIIILENKKSARLPPIGDCLGRDGLKGALKSYTFLSCKKSVYALATTLGEKFAL